MVLTSETMIDAMKLVHIQYLCLDTYHFMGKSLILRSELCYYLGDGTYFSEVQQYIWQDDYFELDIYMTGFHIIQCI